MFAFVFGTNGQALSPLGVRLVSCLLLAIVTCFAGVFSVDIGGFRVGFADFWVKNLTENIKVHPPQLGK